MSADIEGRVQALEELLAHRDKELHDLSDMVARQWTRLDALERELTRARDRVAALEAEHGEAPAADQKPPHW